MKCNFLKVKQKNYKKFIYCDKLKQEINFNNCKNCSYKEYKQYNHIKKRSNKLIRKEKERYSIIYTNLTKCCECGLNNGDYDTRINQYTYISKNEVFEGAYRSKSMQLGMITPFCIYCHDLFHNDIFFNLKYKTMFQKEYLKNHTIDEFINIFGQNYEEKLKQKKRQGGVPAKL